MTDVLNQRDLTELLCEAINKDAKEFTIKPSSQLSFFRLDEEFFVRPRRARTFKDAYDMADTWVTTQLGGDARIYHIPTGIALNMEQVYDIKEKDFVATPNDLFPGKF